MANQEERFSALFQALEQRCYFKLICGGSFSDTSRLESLIHAYAQAGVQAVDVSAHPDVVSVAAKAFSLLSRPPVLMVSFPLDDDPHFRKIQLDAEACTVCEACLPVCPTQVFSIEQAQLLVESPLCYGCDRCVPVCPTNALSLDEFALRPGLIQVLSNPAVEAVEIHATYCDPVMVERLFAELGDLLFDKLISVCFRPQLLPLAQSISFIKAFQEKTVYPLIVQVDGKPMSATDDPEASREALDSARDFAMHLPEGCFLTISGGINAHTAAYLQEPCYRPIQGVGMGTAARQQVWAVLADPVSATRIATRQVEAFQSDNRSAIIKLK